MSKKCCTFAASKLYISPMKKIIFTCLLAAVSSLWSVNEAACLVSRAKQAGTHVEDLTGLLAWDSYPCYSNEDCPDCMTYVLLTAGKTYYLTGEKADEMTIPEGAELQKVVVSGTIGNNGYYDWLEVEDFRLSEEPITTNIITYGCVEDENGNHLTDIQIIVHSEDESVRDTVYTQTDGRFCSTIYGIIYPVQSMKVTAVDPKGQFKSQTITTTYMYECGVDFNPENDTAFPPNDIKFVLEQKDEKAAIQTLSDASPILNKKYLIDGQLYLINNGKIYTVTGQSVR